MSRRDRRSGGRSKGTPRQAPPPRRNKSIPTSTVPRAPREARAAGPRLAGARELAGRAWAAPILGLAALYVLSLVVYGLLAGDQAVPSLFPDEFIYGNVAQNIAHGEGANWRGVSQGVPLLYPLALSLPFRIGSPVDGYEAAKLLGVALSSLVVVPVWLLGRELAGPRHALAAAVLSIAGAWTSFSALLLSENLAIPFAAGSLAATVMALRRPGTRWVWVALGLALLAAYTRVLLASLPVAILLALVVDVLRQPRAERAGRAQAHRPALAVLGALTVAGIVVVLVSSTVGRYSLSTFGDISIGGVISSFAKHGLSLVVMVAGLPAAAAIALALRGENWRDPDSGPLLAVLFSATAVILTVAAAFGEANDVPWPIERYIVYLVPLLFLSLMLVPGRVSWRTGLIVSVLLSIALLGVPDAIQPVEQAALYGAKLRLGDNWDIWLAVIGVATGAAGIWLLTRRADAERNGALFASGLVLVLLVVTAQAAWHDQLRRANGARASLPVHLDWVERATPERVGLVNEGETVAFDVLARRRLRIPDYQIEFFNRNVREIYVGKYVGTSTQSAKTCPWRIGPTGAIQTGAGCEQPPRTLLFLGGVFSSTLRQERLLRTTREGWRLVSVPSAPARVLAIVRSPCNEVICTGDLRVNTWLDRPGEIVVTFTANDDVRVATIKRIVSLRKGQRRVIRTPVTAGPQGLQMLVQGNGGFPDTAVRVREGAKVTRVY